MRTLRLLFVLLFGVVLSGSVSAQEHHKHHKKENDSAVYMVAMEDGYGNTIAEIVEVHHIAARGARDDFEQTRRYGAKQVPNPQFIFSTPDNRFSLGIGGFVNLRTSYDFKGAVNNIDFVPYDIAVGGNPLSRQRVMMDATTSRLFTKAVINTSKLGQIVAFVDMDFRGGAEFSYTPRLRTAYVTMLGFTVGRDYTTFCDLEACPITVDFQGPNAYNQSYATLLRYEHSLFDKRLQMGVAAEFPAVSGTYGEHFLPISQRVPDIPMYVQYRWGQSGRNHVRATAVLRNMYLHNSSTGSNTSLFGWGVQLSGHIEPTKYLTLYCNGTYGKGISNYIQDLNGSGLDFTPNPENPYQIQTMPMWGWQIAAQVNICPGKMFLSGGYSMVGVQEENGYYSAEQYKRGTYLFVNTFYQLTSNCRLAIEYLHGSRKDMSDARGTANRLSVMVQYNF